VVFSTRKKEEGGWRAGALIGAATKKRAVRRRIFTLLNHCLSAGRLIGSFRICWHLQTYYARLLPIALLYRCSQHRPSLKELNAGSKLPRSANGAASSPP